MSLATKTTTIDGTYRITYRDQDDPIVFAIHQGKAQLSTVDAVAWAPFRGARKTIRIVKALDKLLVWGNSTSLIECLETTI
jgi:hypothetical protein